MKAIIENGGINIFLEKDKIDLFRDLLFFNSILGIINNSIDRDEVQQQMTALIAKARLNNKRVQFTFGFNSEFTYMEVYQDENPNRIIFVDFENQ